MSPVGKAANCSLMVSELGTSNLAFSGTSPITQTLSRPGAPCSNYVKVIGMISLENLFPSTNESSTDKKGQVFSGIDGM